LSLNLRKDSDEKKWKRAACGLDTQKAAARLAQAAVMMAFAVKDCSASWQLRTHQGKKHITSDETLDQKSMADDFYK